MRLVRAVEAWESAVARRDTVIVVDHLINHYPLLEQVVPDTLDDRLFQVVIRLFDALSLTNPPYLENLPEEYVYSFLRFMDAPSSRQARFRRLSLSPGMDRLHYDTVDFERNAQGRFQVVDLQSSEGGGLADVTRARTHQLLQFVDPESQFARTGSQLAMADSLIRLAIEKRYREYFDAYDVEVSNPFFPHVLAVNYVRAGIYLGTEEYQQAIDHYLDRYGDDLALRMVVINEYAHHRDSELLLRMVEEVDREVGGDPLLDDYRFHAYQDLGMYEDSHAAANRLVDAFPGWPEAYYLRIDAAVALRDFEAVMTDMLYLEEQNLATFDEALVRQNMPTFVASEHFGTWLNQRPTRED